MVDNNLKQMIDHISGIIDSMESHEKKILLNHSEKIASFYSIKKLLLDRAHKILGETSSILIRKKFSELKSDIVRLAGEKDESSVGLSGAFLLFVKKKFFLVPDKSGVFGDDVSDLYYENTELLEEEKEFLKKISRDSSSLGAPQQRNPNELFSAKNRILESRMRLVKGKLLEFGYETRKAGSFFADFNKKIRNELDAQKKAFTSVYHHLKSMENALSAKKDYIDPGVLKEQLDIIRDSLEFFSASLKCESELVKPLKQYFEGEKSLAEKIKETYSSISYDELKDVLRKEGITDPKEIVSLVENLNNMGIEIKDKKIWSFLWKAHGTSSRLIHIINKENETYKKAATEDTLTRIGSRFSFELKIHQVINNIILKQKNPELCILFSDIDNFKGFNDIYGHGRGDLALKKVAGILKSKTKAKDEAFRWGGEEIVVLCEGANKENGIKIGKRLRNEVETGTADGLMNGLKGVNQVFFDEFIKNMATKIETKSDQEKEYYSSIVEKLRALCDSCMGNYSDAILDKAKNIMADLFPLTKYDKKDFLNSLRGVRTKVTISIGGAFLSDVKEEHPELFLRTPGSSDSVEEDTEKRVSKIAELFLKKADEAVYKAKENGRNQLVFP